MISASLVTDSPENIDDEEMTTFCTRRLLSQLKLLVTVIITCLYYGWGVLIVGIPEQQVILCELRLMCVSVPSINNSNLTK